MSIATPLVIILSVDVLSALTGGLKEGIFDIRNIIFQCSSCSTQTLLIFLPVKSLNTISIFSVKIPASLYS